MPVIHVAYSEAYQKDLSALVCMKEVYDKKYILVGKYDTKADAIWNIVSEQDGLENYGKILLERFANELKKELNGYGFWKYDIVSEGHIEEKDVSRDWMIDEILRKIEV